MQNADTVGRAARRRGHAVMEVALIAPWIFFVFVATLNFGFYSYWMQAVANASRSAALAAQRRGVNAAEACTHVQNEMRGVLGFDGVTLGDCTSATSPIKVCVVALGSAPVPACGVTWPVSADTKDSVLVSVTWETAPLIPVPGIVTDLTLRQDTEMRVQ